MKNFFDKLLTALSVLAPMVMVVFVWSAYLYVPKKEELKLDLNEPFRDRTQKQLYRSSEFIKTESLKSYVISGHSASRN